MIFAPYPPEPLLERLLDCLDRQIQMLEDRREQMERLFGAIAGHDNEAMELLLAQMERMRQKQDLADRELQSIRQDLADATNCPVSEMRLARLVKDLPADLARVVAGRRRSISRGLGRLRRQHLQTSLLLHECQKVNRLLLESILHRGPQSRTYGANGQLRCRESEGLMSAEL